LLYDLTNTHFEGLSKQNPKAKRGMNKQKRNIERVSTSRPSAMSNPVLD
jgi:hypothetical protein